MPSSVLTTIDPQDIPLLTLPSVSFSNRKALPKCAAIYFVLNAQGTVLYVGQSINLAKRWAAHHRVAALTEKQAVRIAWLVMADDALLDAVEAACLAYFDPICNGHHSAHAGRPKTEASTYVRLYASLPPDLLDDLHARAQAGNRPLNNELVTVVRAGLQALKEQERLPSRRRIRQPLLETGGRP